MFSRRWTIVALLFTGALINYVDRQALSVVAPILRDEFDISNFGYGQIVFSFLLAYTIGQAAAGWLIDRLGTRNGYTLIMIWWSLAGILHATGRGVLSFSIFRFLLGIGQAGIWAASVRGISEWFRSQERAFPVAIFGTGTSVGLMIAVPVVAVLTQLVGWRGAFVLTGLVGFVWVGFWVKLYRSPETPAIGAPAAASLDASLSSASSQQSGYRTLVMTRTAWALILGRMFADPIAWFYNAWVPEYLHRVRGFSLGDIGRYGWIPFFAQLCGITLGGVISDRLCRRGWRIVHARLTVMFAGVLLMTSGAGAAFAADTLTAMTAISLAVFGFGLWAPNMMTLGADLFPKNVGAITGLHGVGAGVGGMTASLITGWTLDHFSYKPVFLGAGLLPLVAFTFVISLIDRHTPAGRG